MGGWPTKSAQQHTLKLPSGVTVEVKRPSLISMLSHGGLPTTLAVAVWKVAGNQYKPNTENADDIKMMAEQVAVFTARTLRSIKVHLLPEDGQPDARPETDVMVDEHGIARGVARIEDIPDADQMAVFLYARGIEPGEEEKEASTNGQGVATAETLTTFPSGSDAAGAPAGSGGAPVSPAAVAADRDLTPVPSGG